MEQEINRLIVEDALQSRHAARERHARPPASRSSAGEAEQKNRRRTTRTSKGRAEVKTPFRALFELSPDASLLFVAGVVAHANAAAGELFHARSAARLIGRRSKELLHADCVPDVERRVTAFMTERVKSMRVHERYVRLDGSDVDVETTVARATFMQGKSFIVSMREYGREDPACRPLGRPPKGLMELIANLAAQHRLPPSHRRIVCAATESSSHDVICAKLDISRNTLKTHIRQILERTGAHSLERLVAPLRALVLRL